MAFRIRAAFGIALLVSLVVSIMASAKGGFNFVTISGPGLKEPMRVTDPALTRDFFTFADFYEDKTKAPAQPGEDYEILRYYVDGKREIVFDRLHYYPETGFVFYDGIENGESEYDGDWYTAKPEIKTIFESALSAQTQSVAPVDKQAVTSREPTNSNEFLSGSMVLAIIASLTMILALAFWLRKSTVH
jgi:hypothetical protein